MRVAAMNPIPPTTHTSGFVDITQNPMYSRAFSFAGTAGSLTSASTNTNSGGLASSPNVPRPGSTINPATGLPHTAGITRAELNAQREAAAAAVNGTGSGIGAGKPLAEMDGREQAARQLTGTVDPPGEISPGEELPGGWGPVKTVPAPGTAPNAPSTMYEDVEVALNKIGHVAFSVIPNQLKEVLSAHPTEAGGQAAPTASAVPEARRSSFAGLLDSAKEQVKHVTHEVAEAVNKSSLVSGGARRGSANAEAGEAPFYTAAKDLWDSVVKSADSGSRGVHAGPAATRVSLPSDELTGAREGEHSSGAGALPGKSTEAGVAILPDEKKPKDTLPSQENQGMLPGENSGGVGALPGPSTAVGVAVVPDESVLTSSYGLAPPLPGTAYGQGAAHGATKIEATAIATVGIAAGDGDVGGHLPTTSSSSAPDTVHSTERANSTASVTAIRDGHEGELAALTTIPSAVGGSPLSAASNPNTASRVSGAICEAPGDATNAVGHPKSRVAREPGSYPAPEHDIPVAVGSGASNPVSEKSKNIISTEDQAHPMGAATVVAHDHNIYNENTSTNESPIVNNGSTAGASGTPIGTASVASTQRRRSSGDSGKKKVGFMNKLKGEIKVISGKISNDDSKVAEGERLKHGE